MGSGSAGWKWVRKGEKGKNWMAECFSSIPGFFPAFSSISAVRDPCFFRSSHPQEGSAFAPRSAQLHSQLQMAFFNSKPFNNSGSDYFLLLQLICWLRAAKDDGVKLSGARLKRMEFSCWSSLDVQRRKEN